MYNKDNDKNKKKAHEPQHEVKKTDDTPDQVNQPDDECCGQGCCNNEPFNDAPGFVQGSHKRYSFDELGNWVHLMIKRSTHRTDQKKRAKDLFDANQYLKMISSGLGEFIENSTPECKAEFERLVKELESKKG